MHWYDHNWLIAVATFLGVAVFYRQLRSMGKKNEFDALLQGTETFARRFGKDAAERDRFYGLRRRFEGTREGNEGAPEPKWGSTAYRERLIARIEMVAALTPDERDKDFTVVSSFVNTINDFAELIDFRFLEAQRVLSKYHLAIAREIFLAEPYIYYKCLPPQSGRWGFRVLQLGEMARRYNDINPIHRRPIYFMEHDQPDISFGAIYPAPESPWLPLLKSFWAVRRRLGYPSITERGKRRQERGVRKLARQTKYIWQDSQT